MIIIVHSIFVFIVADGSGCFESFDQSIKQYAYENAELNSIESHGTIVYGFIIILLIHFCMFILNSRQQQHLGTSDQRTHGHDTVLN